MADLTEVIPDLSFHRARRDGDPIDLRRRRRINRKESLRQEKKTESRSQNPEERPSDPPPPLSAS